jgi:hypothetical protein
VSLDLCPVATGQSLALLSSSAAWRRWMLAEGGRLSSPEVGANVGHLFSNATGSKQGNTIVNCYGPSSSEALSPHRYNAHRTKDKKYVPSSFNV